MDDAALQHSNRSKRATLPALLFATVTVSAGATALLFAARVAGLSALSTSVGVPLLTVATSSASFILWLRAKKGPILATLAGILAAGLFILFVYIVTLGALLNCGRACE